MLHNLLYINYFTFFPIFYFKVLILIYIYLWPFPYGGKFPFLNFRNRSLFIGMTSTFLPYVFLYISHHNIKMIFGSIWFIMYSQCILNSCIQCFHSKFYYYYHFVSSHHTNKPYIDWEFSDQNLLYILCVCGCLLGQFPCEYWKSRIVSSFFIRNKNEG